MRTLILSLSAPILLVACASSANTSDTPKGAAKFAEDPRLGAETDRICFASNIDSFGNTTRDTFTVREGGSDYLVEVFSSCTPLRNAQTIGFDATGSCLRRGDAVIVSETITASVDSAPFETQRCIVNSIYEWYPDAETETGDTEQAMEEN